MKRLLNSFRKMETIVGEPKTRAQRAIIWYITQFCLTHVYDGDRRHGSIHGFHSTFGADEAKVGDLIALQSAPISKWSLSWLVEIERNNGGFTRYLCESIEDGSQCWWHNVDIDYLERKEVAAHPEWRWTDRQFAFNDRWRRVCFKEKDAYITLPLDASFGEGYAVTLGTRTRFGFDEHLPKKTFHDWRKVTKQMMRDLYDEAVASRPVPKVA